MAEKEAAGSNLDVSQLRTPIQISGKPVEQVLSSIHYGSPELRCLLMDECDLIFECKVCRALFRDLPNFISHKRVYCTKSSMDNRHVTIASLPEEKVVVIQPQAPEETEKAVNSSNRKESQYSKSTRPNLEETIQRIQSGELGKSHAYQVYTEAAEKLQRQKEGMKVATIRTTAIPTNKNAVFIDVNMASVNIHERQQQVNCGAIASYDQNRNDTSVTVIKRKVGERAGSTRNVRKSVRQEKPSTEPQKLLMEQLKEIQHKVKQKVAAAQDKVVQQKRVKIVPQNSVCDKDSTPSLGNESSLKAVVNPNAVRVQKKASNCTGLKMIVSENAQPVLDKEEETKVHVKNELKNEQVNYAVVKRRPDNKISPKTAKENSVHKVALRRRKFAKRSLICSKCNSIFATRKSLGYHVKIHHSAKRTFYPCPYCPSVFYYFFAITRHLFKSHSKTLEEVDGMRKQLREKSFTKPFCVPSLKKETENVSSSGRSTRTSGRSLLLSTSSQDEYCRTDKSLFSDKHLPKRRTSEDTEIPSSDASLKVARQKSTHLNITQDELLHSPKSSGTTVQDKSLDVVKTYNTKEETGESRPVRLKNKQQQGIVGKPSTSVGLADTSTGMITTKPNQTSPFTASRHQENTLLACPKCHRSFRRKISCQNHVKVCMNEGKRVLRTVRSQITRVKGRLGTQGLKSSRDSISTKVNRKTKISANDSAVKTTATNNRQSTSYLKNAEKKDKSLVNQNQSRFNNSLRQNTSRNSKLTHSDSNSSLSQRSSSVDRVIKRDESRNRSQHRNSTVRDERDSSVDSTQSNVECPRNRRNVLSRYATPTLLSKSPQKTDTLISSPGSDNDDMIKWEVVPQMDEKKMSSELSDFILSNDGDKTSIDCNKNEDIKSEKESTVESKKEIINLSETQVKAKTSLSRNTDLKKHIGQVGQLTVLPSDFMNTRFMLTREMTRGGTLQQKKLPPPQNLKSSLQKPQISPNKSNFFLRKPPQNNPSTSFRDEFPHKQLGSADMSILFQRMNVDLIPKPGTSSPEFKHSETLSILQSKSLENITTEPICTKNTKEKPEKDVLKLQQKVKLDIKESEHSEPGSLEIFKNNLMKTLPQVEEHVKEKPDEVILFECNSTNDSLDLDLAKPNLEVLDSKGSEMVHEELNAPKVKSNCGNSKNKDSKSQSLQQKTVISALSERPKRKRKVPNRNRDAEEMLSKMLSHDRDAVPEKKRKVIRESKAADIQKQKLKDGSTFSSADIDDKDNVNSDDKVRGFETITVSSEIDQSQADDDREDDIEELEKSKGRFVSNRKYVLDDSGSKKNKFKCYDQMKVYKLIDEENRKCLECGESCTLVSNLRKHVIRQHLKWSRFRCKLCKFESYDRSECTTHLIRVHRNNIINGRNGSHYIIDLVKKGSHVRSLKKNETTKVKQQSESQEGNIYARPTVKKMLRLSQRAHGETTTPLATSDSKKLVRISSSPHKSEIVSRLQFSHPQISPKLGSDQSADGKDASLKAARKSLPFNISTRNSPRTFDTRPYNPEKGDLPADTEVVSVPKPESLGKVVPSTENVPKTLGNEDKNNPEQMETVIPDVQVNNDPENNASSDFSNTDNAHKSRNIFDKMRSQNASSLSQDTVSHIDNNSIVNEPVSSNDQELYLVASSVAIETASPKNLEVKIAGPLQVIDHPKYVGQTPSAHTKSLGVNVQSSKVISYIIRAPPQNLHHVSEEVIISDTLTKSLTKLKEHGDQITSQTSSQPILKTAVTATKVPVSSSQIIAAANGQRKQTHMPASSANVVKTTSVEQIKLAPHKTLVTSKDTAGPSSGITLTAALTKSGCISTTVASSLVQGQSGKFIIYTRPVGAKDLTTVGSLTKPLPSSSTALATVVKSPDSKPGSEIPETTEEVFPPGTIVIHKHYL